MKMAAAISVKNISASSKRHISGINGAWRKQRNIIWQRNISINMT